MCYSAKSSIIAFTVGELASIYLLLYGDKYDKNIGIFFMAVLGMQLLEFLMWTDQKCGLINHFASKSINLFLGLQIVALVLGAYLFNTSIIPKHILKIILIFVVIFVIYNGSFRFFINEGKLCTKPNKDNSLQWDKFDLNIILSLIYLFIFVAFPFLMKEKFKAMIVLILGIMSLYFNQYHNQYTLNSRWCYYSAFIPVILVIFRIFKINLPNLV